MSDEEIEAVMGGVAVTGLALAVLGAVWGYMRLIAAIVTFLIG